eukprot:TRINITY_DN6584_c0_g2_i1.p1 TRINITY_DN6584_c0_g2~~TRINITY_DN6584_c0_g2_i1.p1  ORF type:complete len:270 (-),score=46.48 TRINITY_DN6584_c0_g2_i1:60-869(-)
MAGQPVQNPFGQNLGPAPRIGGGVQAPGAGADGLQFFTPPAGGMQPAGPAPAAQAPGNFPPPGVVQQPVGGQMGQMQPGNFPAPRPVSTPVSSYDDDFENEPPLLEELGINVEHTLERMKGVAFFKKLDEEILRDADLSGPLAICMTLGTALLLAGKLQFGYIYGLAAGGSLGICCLINVMSQKEGIDLYRTMSILGYGLIPIVFLAVFGIVVSLRSSFGMIMAALCIGWATATSSRFFATAISMQDQRWLVAYPVGLVYTFFTLITIF